MPDYYEILGVKRGATHGEIKKAYCRLALGFHPDKLPKEAQELDRLEKKKKDGELLSQLEEGQIAELEEKLEKFKEVTLAYRVLSDQASRARYDRGEDFIQQISEDWLSETLIYINKLRHEFYEKCDELEVKVSKFTEKMCQKDLFFTFYEIYFKKIIELGDRICKSKGKEIEVLRKRQEYYETIQSLLKNIESNEYEKCSDIIKKVTIAADDITPLVQIAIAYDRVEIFELFEGRIEISPNDILSYAYEYRSEKFLDYFFNKYLDRLDINYKDEKGNTALHHTLKWLDLDKSKYQGFVKSLLSKGARLDVKNEQDKTPFDLLVNYAEYFFREEKAVERLNNLSVMLSCCKTDELKKLEGTPALNKLVDTIVKYEHKKALNLLVENNIKISSITLENIVTRNRNKKIFDCFLHKNKIDYQDESGDTALHHALRNLHSDKSMLCKVESLVSAGARFDVKNDQGETPFDLLVEYVEKGFYGQASRLSYAWKLLNKCENIRELKYKDGIPALDKLNELRIKCRNTSIIVASTLAVVGVALGVAIAVCSDTRYKDVSCRDRSWSLLSCCCCNHISL
uniref:Chaperone protein DnaJ n=1 Tax=Wolbachia endosymbiont of Aleurodicus floccissimus TaxID=2152762 RepID=A0A3B0IX14_9RICK